MANGIRRAAMLGYPPSLVAHMAATATSTSDTAVTAATDVRDTKASVRVATAAALPTNTRTSNVLTASANGALAAVDGVTLVVGDRLLVKNEVTGANNGIYTVTTLGAAGAPFTLTRATDANTSAKVSSGMFVVANEGTANGDTGWLLTTNDPITLNTTALVFAQFPAP